MHLFKNCGKEHAFLPVDRYGERSCNRTRSAPMIAAFPTRMRAQNGTDDFRFERRAERIEHRMRRFFQNGTPLAAEPNIAANPTDVALVLDRVQSRGAAARRFGRGREPPSSIANARSKGQEGRAYRIAGASPALGAVAPPERTAARLRTRAVDMCGTPPPERLSAAADARTPGTHG